MAEGNLFVQTAALRQILGAATGAELHPDRNRAGYRFVAPVPRVEAAPRNGQRGPGNFGKLGVEF